MINKKIKSIFTKCIIFLIAIININNLKAEELKEVKVKVRSKGNISVSLRCSADNGNYCNEIIRNFQDSDSIPQNIGAERGSCNIKLGHNYYTYCVTQNIYKHTFPDGRIMYSASSAPNHFANSLNNLEWYFNPMDLLKVMPEIGISRIDPNLIEY